ncbi:hypothetical protein [Namhaeicola litoreus]|uniref:t-SNARE coiled-coil homology domain-containing protein n=1 Tax=Namhaeicola litoreus TaxID=1052145 RepID=A0ABW3Y099_9FLAO
MNNDKIQQSLIELEENLKNLNSARNQVISMAGNSQKLSQEVLLLVNSFQELNKNLSQNNFTSTEHFKSFFSRIEESVNQFSVIIDDAANDLQKMIYSNAESFSVNLDAITQEHVVASQNIIQDKKNVFDALIEKQTLFSGKLEELKNELNEFNFHEKIALFQTELNQQSDWIKKVVQQIDKTKSEVQLEFQNFSKSYENQNMLIADKFKDLSNLVEANQKKQSIYQYLIISLIIVTTLILFFK